MCQSIQAPMGDKNFYQTLCSAEAHGAPGYVAANSTERPELWQDTVHTALISRRHIMVILPHGVLAITGPMNSILMVND